jgi:hypothetical protein
MPKQLIKTPPIGFTQDNFCAVVDPRSPNPKTETRRLSNGSDKPKYKVGDRCYLTEPTQIESAPDQALHCVVNYFWSNPESLWKEITLDDKFKIESRKSGIKSKQNPRFMLKSFARYWVEIVDVNHERLQDITDEAAIAEGIKYHVNRGYLNGELNYEYPLYWDYMTKSYSFKSPITSYLSEIVAIHKPAKGKIGGWDLVKSNPWLWVYKFKLSQGGDEHV